MGRLFLVKFDQTNPEVNFYCCRICQAHIALSQDCTGMVRRQVSFSKVFNVTAWHRGMDSLIEDLYCVKCNMLLGWGYIQSVSHYFVPNERVVLNLDDLQFWNGVLLRNADERLPPVENQEG